MALLFGSFNLLILISTVIELVDAKNTDESSSSSNQNAPYKDNSSKDKKGRDKDIEKSKDKKGKDKDDKDSKDKDDKDKGDKDKDDKDKEGKDKDKEGKKDKKDKKDKKGKDKNSKDKNGKGSKDAPAPSAAQSTYELHTLSPEERDRIKNGVFDVRDNAGEGVILKPADETRDAMLTDDTQNPAILNIVSGGLLPIGSLTAFAKAEPANGNGNGISDGIPTTIKNSAMNLLLGQVSRRFLDGSTPFYNIVTRDLLSRRLKNRKYLKKCNRRQSVMKNADCGDCYMTALADPRNRRPWSAPGWTGQEGQMGWEGQEGWEGQGGREGREGWAGREGQEGEKSDKDGDKEGKDGEKDDKDDKDKDEKDKDDKDKDKDDKEGKKDDKKGKDDKEASSTGADDQKKPDSGAPTKENNKAGQTTKLSGTHARYTSNALLDNSMMFSPLF